MEQAVRAHVPAQDTESICVDSLPTVAVALIIIFFFFPPSLFSRLLSCRRLSPLASLVSPAPPTPKVSLLHLFYLAFTSMSPLVLVVPQTPT